MAKKASKMTWEKAEDATLFGLIDGDIIYRIEGDIASHKEDADHWMLWKIIGVYPTAEAAKKAAKKEAAN